MEQSENTIQYGDNLLKAEIKSEPPSDINKYSHKPIESPKKTVVCTENEFILDFGGVVESQIIFEDYEFEGVFKSEQNDPGLRDETLERIHTGEKLYSLKNSSHKFKNIRNWKKHEEIHEKPHIGEVLNSSRSTDPDLMTQSFIHTSQEPPFQTIENHAAVEVNIEENQTQEEIYSCNQCSLQFSDSYSSEVHKREHITTEKAYACSKCPYKSRLLWPLKRHEKIHTEEKYYTCKECLLQFADTYSYMEHKKEHIGAGRFSCDECSYKCNRPYSLKVHKRTHTGEKPYSCNKCPYKSSLPQTLKRHEKIHTDEKPFPCSQCSSRSREKLSLKAHESIHSQEKPFACKECMMKDPDLMTQAYFHTSQEPQFQTIENHAAVEVNIEQYQTQEEIYSCNQCSLQFSDSYSYVVHKREHMTSEKAYACSKCPYKSGLLWTLKRHEKIHTEGKYYTCKECLLQFADKYSYVVHRRGKGRFSCDECSYKCNRPYSLKVHKRTHTGEKLYSCNECPYKCTKLLYLKRHKKIHTVKNHLLVVGAPTSIECTKKLNLKNHKTTLIGEGLSSSSEQLDLMSQSHARSDTSEKSTFAIDENRENIVVNIKEEPTQEDIYSCADEYNYVEHKRMHREKLEIHKRIPTSEKPYSCDRCSSTFVYAVNLAMHNKRFHSGEEFSCSRCSYQCSHISDLKRHELIHAGEKPFACNQCSFKSGYQSILRKHQRSHIQGSKSNLQIE